MKNVNLSVDGGGTSLRIVAFDDDLNLLARGGSGAVNPNFESGQKIRENIFEALAELAAGLGKNFKICRVYKTMVGSGGLFGELFENFTRELGLAGDMDICDISESRSHLLAASLGDAGGVALAGTGSGAIYCAGGKTIHLGGCGIPVGDEGSGAWIGIQAMSAAFRHIYGWGEETQLTLKLYEYLGCVPPEAPTGALYRKEVSQRGLFAGFCKYAAACERAGDKAARKIIYSAGENMGLQMISAVKKAEAAGLIDTKKEPPAIYASGGAWKGTPYMFETMAKTVQNEYPKALCANGLFDPVIAGVISFIFEKTKKREISENTLNHLKKEFENYLFKYENGGNL
ncbi:MAG: hypothetical protein FWD23_16930 [Oscillospiraceae bacterium]|nr:hypothetical protein [Oscillospiraceae bacterium]